MKKRGFTLVELIVTVSIIAVLSTVIIIAYGSSQARARDAKRKTDIQAIATALDMYKADQGTYRVVHAASHQETKWNTLAGSLRGYLDPLPKDPINEMSDVESTLPWLYAVGEKQYAYSVYTFPTCTCSDGGVPVVGNPEVSGYCLAANLETSSGNGSNFESGKCGVFNNVGRVRDDHLYIMERHYYVPSSCPETTFECSP